MEQVTKMLRSYLVRFSFRLLVLINVFCVYLTNRSLLDFTCPGDS